MILPHSTPLHSHLCSSNLHLPPKEEAADADGDPAELTPAAAAVTRTKCLLLSGGVQNARARRRQARCLRTKLGAAVNRFGDYLCVNCANYPSACGRNQSINTKFTSPMIKISKSSQNSLFGALTCVRVLKTRHPVRFSFHSCLAVRRVQCRKECQDCHSSSSSSSSSIRPSIGFMITRCRTRTRRDRERKGKILLSKLNVVWSNLVRVTPL